MWIFYIKIICVCITDSRGGNRGNYGNFGEESGRDWNRGGSGGGMGGSRGGSYGARPRPDNNRDRRYSEDLPNPAPGI